MGKYHSIVVTGFLALGCHADETRAPSEESAELAPEEMAPKELPEGDPVEVAHNPESLEVASDIENLKGLESQDHPATAERPDFEPLDEIGNVPDISAVTCTCKTCFWASCCNSPLGTCGCEIYEWTVTPPDTCYSNRPLVCICD